MPKQTVRSPYATGDATPLAGRLFRKQILRYSEIDYHGRKVKFDRPYADNVITAFRDDAFPAVPFVLADSDNKHTRDPERARGEVVDLEATDEGLDAIIRLDPKAVGLVKQYPKLGVSVSIREQFDRADGKHYPAALAHVLGTFEPMLPGMSAWQNINASIEGEEVLDLTTVNLAGPKTKENTVPRKYTDEEQDGLLSRLEQFLTKQETDVEPDDEVEEEELDEAAEDDEDELTNADIEELRAFLSAYDAGEFNEDDGGSSTGGNQGAEELVNASITEHPQVVEMSNTIRQLRAENDRRSFEQERDQIVRDLGIPPFIVDLARPLLQGVGHDIELSDTGKKVDAGQIMREVLKAVGKQITLLDLSGELGNNIDFSRDDDVEEKRKNTLSRVKAARAQMNI